MGYARVVCGRSDGHPLIKYATGEAREYQSATESIHVVVGHVH